MKLINITGQRFGRLIALEYVGPDSGKKSLWRFICDCGNIKEVRADFVKCGDTQSCGCYAKEVRKRNIIKAINNRKLPYNPLYGTKFYMTYAQLKQRCFNKNNPVYPRYGGRGITCFWKDFDSFREDMYESFAEHEKNNGGRNTSIDRIDVDGNYCKENCRWATSKEQANNTRKQKLYKS